MGLQGQTCTGCGGGENQTPFGMCCPCGKRILEHRHGVSEGCGENKAGLTGGWPTGQALRGLRFCPADPGGDRCTLRASELRPTVEWGIQMGTQGYDWGQNWKQVCWSGPEV